MNNVVHLKAIARNQKQAYEGYVSPDHLHGFLAPCETRVVTFRGEKAMNSYRTMIYSINRQGTYRYRTMRDENSAFGLIIWRMK